MGCCVTRIGVLNEFPFEETDEFNKLKIEIVQILNNKDDMNYEDNIQLLELINKINIKIAKCEEIIENLKFKRRIKPKIIREIVQGININIKDLKDYNIFLNNQIKKNKNKMKQKEINEEEKQQKQVKIVTEEKTLNNNKNKNIIFKSQNTINIKPIYYKKNIKTCKYSELFKKNRSTLKKYEKNKISKSYDENIFNHKNNLLTKNSLLKYDDEKEKINIVFILDDGSKLTIENDKKDQFLNAINKLGEKNGEYNNIKDMIIIDVNDEITDRIKKGETISEFRFKDYQPIKIKLIKNKKEE